LSTENTEGTEKGHKTNPTITILLFDPSVAGSVLAFVRVFRAFRGPKGF
jgi:hypothetical protein